jgi:sortase A
VRRAVAVALAATALGLLAEATWIPAKAVLAQVLLRSAWQRARSGEAAPRPWPWADTWPVARLTVPGRGIELYVLAGASGRNLAFGPAHVDGTARPGAVGNCALAGHRDTSFAFLRDLAPGDELVLETPDGRRRRYRVREAGVFDRSDTWLLAPQPVAGPERLLTLVTCYPFDAVVPGGPGRYVVRAVAERGPDGLDRAS